MVCKRFVHLWIWLISSVAGDRRSTKQTNPTPVVNDLKQKQQSNYQAAQEESISIDKPSWSLDQIKRSTKPGTGEDAWERYKCEVLESYMTVLKEKEHIAFIPYNNGNFFRSYTNDLVIWLRDFNPPESSQQTVGQLVPWMMSHEHDTFFDKSAIGNESLEMVISCLSRASMLAGALLPTFQLINEKFGHESTMNLLTEPIPNGFLYASSISNVVYTSPLHSAVGMNRCETVSWILEQFPDIWDNHVTWRKGLTTGAWVVAGLLGTCVAQFEQFFQAHNVSPNFDGLPTVHPYWNPNHLNNAKIEDHIEHTPDIRMLVKEAFGMHTKMKLNTIDGVMFENAVVTLRDSTGADQIKTFFSAAISKARLVHLSPLIKLLAHEMKNTLKCEMVNREFEIGINGSATGEGGSYSPVKHVMIVNPHANWDPATLLHETAHMAAHVLWNQQNCVPDGWKAACQADLKQYPLGGKKLSEVWTKLDEHYTCEVEDDLWLAEAFAITVEKIFDGMSTSDSRMAEFVFGTLMNKIDSFFENLNGEQRPQLVLNELSQ